MALWLRVGLLTIVIVYHLCHSNGILDSVNNSDAYDNFLNNISENLVGIATDNQSDATTFVPSFKSTGDQTRILDGESGVEEAGIINSNLTRNYVNDPMPSTRPNEQPDTPTRISSVNSNAAVFNTDSDTSTSKPGVDSAVISIERYLPEIESLCPGINVCGRTRDYDGTAPTYETNHCCLNCSCEPSCIDYRNCCYDDLVTDGQHEMFDCLLPIVGDYGMDILSEMPAYRFVVVLPMDGCKTADHIKTKNIRYMDENVSPWGDFYPIYSKSFNLNFKNEKTAICHGANDIEHWKPMAINRGNYQGGQVMTNFFSTFNFSAVFIVFEPPRPEIIHRNFMCFREFVGSCPITRINTFAIPSYMQTDREGIVAACEYGPRALYRVNPTFAYKNVYCALCNRLVLTSDYVHCGYNGVDERRFRFNSYLVVLLGLDFIDSVNTQGAVLRNKPTDLNCYIPENYVNDVECVPLQCPMFQIRLTDSQCGYPSAVLLIKSINVCLNLSTTNTTDATFFNNLTEAEIHSLFQLLSPWIGCWVIEIIGLRLETNTTEFIIQLNCNAERFELSNLNKSLRKLLRKTWLVPFNNRIIHFKQQLDKHGSTYILGYKPYRRHVFTPEWTAVTNHPIRSSSLLKKVFWKTLYKKFNKIVSYNLLINKLFFCNQIELRNIEYELQYLILYLKRISIHLYPEEYVLFEDEFGSQRALVCLEDSGYIRAGSVTMAMHWRFVVMIFLCIELLATLTNRILFD